MSPLLFLQGTVISGKGRGKALGASTLNLNVKRNLPTHGIYAAWVRFGDHTVQGGHRVKGALHIGPRPTFHEDDVSVEVHLLDLAALGLSENDLPKLGDTVQVEVVGWIREVQAFDSPEALKQAIQEDVAKARELLFVDRM